MSLLAVAAETLRSVELADIAARDRGLQDVLHEIAEKDGQAGPARGAATRISARAAAMQEHGRLWAVVRLSPEPVDDSTAVSPVHGAADIVADLGRIPDPATADRRMLVERVARPALGPGAVYVVDLSSAAVRAPAVLDVASTLLVEAAATTALPAFKPMRVAPTARRRGYEPDLFATPATISGHPVEDMLVRSIPGWMPDNTERDPVRPDVHRLCLFAYACAGATRLDERAGAALIAGTSREAAPTDAVLRRWWRALRVARHLEVGVDETGRFFDRVQVSINEDRTAVVAAPAWWQGRGEMNAWRLTGALHRPPTVGTGGSAGWWGGVSRTLNGIEAAIAYTRPAGRGRGGRRAMGHVPARPGGPGPEISMHWEDVLHSSGEIVGDGNYRDGADGRRYRRRLEALEAAGYFCVDGREATAGDTLEIVGTKRQGAETGILVRASAAFCDAVRRAPRKTSWERIPAMHFLPVPGKR